VSSEVSAVMYDKYYASYFPVEISSDDRETLPDFSFNNFMRATRQTVDNMLARDEVNQAEAYMEQQRLILASHGYLIRKLNQAFFAFYGSYADQPGFENPIANNLKVLRSKCTSLADFVWQASAFTEPDELKQAVG
jgi:hypothetical protein